MPMDFCVTDGRRIPVADCRFDFGTSRQEFRQVRAFGVTYIREEG